MLDLVDTTRRNAQLVCAAIPTETIRCEELLVQNLPRRSRLQLLTSRRCVSVMIHDARENQHDERLVRHEERNKSRAEHSFGRQRTSRSHSKKAAGRRRTTSLGAGRRGYFLDGRTAAAHASALSTAHPHKPVLLVPGASAQVVRSSSKVLREHGRNVGPLSGIAGNPPRGERFYGLLCADACLACASPNCPMIRPADTAMTIACTVPISSSVTPDSLATPR